MTMIEAVLFDFGGTLFSYRPFRDRFLELLVRTAREHGAAHDPKELRGVYARAAAPVAAAYERRPSYLHRDFFGDCGEAFVRALGASPSPSLRQRFYAGQTEVAAPLIRPRESAREVLEELRRGGRHVGIVSNIDQDQFDVLWARCGLDGLADAITTSEQAGSCKPHPAIFRIALEKAGSAPEATLFVGDSLRHDVAGAAALGLRTVLVVEGDEDRDLDSGAAPDHCVRDLGELLTVVGDDRLAPRPSA